MIIELMMVESYQIKMQMIIGAVNKYPTVFFFGGLVFHQVGDCKTTSPAKLVPVWPMYLWATFVPKPPIMFHHFHHRWFFIPHWKLWQSIRLPWCFKPGLFKCLDLQTVLGDFWWSHPIFSQIAFVRIFQIRIQREDMKWHDHDPWRDIIWRFRSCFWDFNKISTFNLQRI